VAAGVLRNRETIAFFTAMERFLYKRATHISLIAEDFRRSLVGKGVPSDKITLIPVWADPNSIQPQPKDNAFRNEHGLNGQFVVLYAGNLGHTSALEEVLGAAEILRDGAGVRFVIVGEGVKKAALEEQAHKKGLGNILFLPFQPRGVFAEVLAAADVSLVTLNRNSSESSFPSKVFNIMASARPILAVARPGSEIANLVKEAECGIVVHPEQPELLAEAILHMKGEAGLLHKMGRNGLAQVTTRFSRAHCVERYDHMLQGVCMKDKGQPVS
jgi:colanic acid biosynthesis glycosyl transferase WcaI